MKRVKTNICRCCSCLHCKKNSANEAKTKCVWVPLLFWFLYSKVCSACACGCISSQFCQCNSPELKFLCENNESSRRVNRRSKVHRRSKDDSALQKKSVLLPELSSSLQKLTTASNALQCLEEKKSMFQSKPTGSPSLMHFVQWSCFCKRSKSQMHRAGCHYQSLLNEDPLCSSARSRIAKQCLLLQLPTPFCLPSNGLI